MLPRADGGSPGQSNRRSGQPSAAVQRSTIAPSGSRRLKSAGTSICPWLLFSKPSRLEAIAMGWGNLPLLLLGTLVLLLVSAGIEDVRTREIANWKNAAIALIAPLWWVASGLAPWPDMAIQIGLAVSVFAVFALVFRSEEHTSELQSLMRISYAV